MKRKNNKMTALLITTGCVIAAYMVILFVGNPLIRKVIYYPQMIDHYPRVGNDIELKIQNGKRNVYGLLSQNGEKLIILFHGNGELINSQEQLARRFYNKGFSTLLIEYPGYGLAHGYSPDERKIYADHSLMVRYVTRTYDYPKQNVRFIGRSLGSGVAIEMMKRGLGEKVILISPYTSIPGLAHESFVPLLPYAVILDRFNTYKKARNIKEPVLMIHGTEDRIIPYTMGKKLESRFPNAELITITGAGHNDIFMVMPDTVWNKIDIFLK